MAAKPRFVVEWSHQMCHPETCSHMGNYRIHDTVIRNSFRYSDNEKELQAICDRMNREELAPR